MELAELVTQCIEYAIQHGIAAYEVVENARNTNRLYDKTYSLFKELKYNGNKGINQLRKLLEHPNDYVRATAAIRLLSVDTEKARDILLSFSTQRNVFGFVMEMTVKEWDKGNIRDYLS